MTLFKKKLFPNDNDFYYRFYQTQQNEVEDELVAEERLKKIIQPGTPASSCWWKNLKAKSGLNKSYEEYLKGLHEKVFYQHDEESINQVNSGFMGITVSTIKQCPAVIGILKNVFVVTAPCDINITVDGHGNFLSNFKIPGYGSISIHDKSQYENSNASCDIFKDKINIKISLNVYFKTKNTYLYMPPVYHQSHPDLEVLTGMIEGSKTHTRGRKEIGSELNINTMVKVQGDEIKTISIKQGDVLAYILPFKPAKMVFSKHNFLQCV